MLASSETITTAITSAPSIGRKPAEREPVRLDRPDLATLIELDERPHGRGLHDRSAEQRQRRAERDHQQHQDALSAGLGIDPGEARRAEDERLQERVEQRDRQQDRPDADEQPDPVAIHARRGRQDLAPRSTPREPQGCGRTPGGPRGDDREKPDQDGEGDEHQGRTLQRAREQVRAASDRAAEEGGGPRAERAAGGHRDAAAAPAARPAERLGPLRLEVRPGRPVEERRLQLAPASLERDPGERPASRGRVAGNRLDLRVDVERRPQGVVTADALRAGGAEEQRLAVEVRVGPVGRVNHRVRAVHQLELAVAPAGTLAALVLAVPDLLRGAGQGLVRGRGVEVELDHLPVALVEVVPVVEGVEQPVLQCQTTGRVGLGDDVRVGDLREAFGDAASPLLVPATGVEGVTGEVEVVLVESLREVGSGRGDLDEIGATPWPAQRNGRIPEQRVDVHRLVRLPRAALVVLGDEPDHGRVALRERGLIGQAGRSARPACERRAAPPRARRGRSVRPSAPRTLTSGSSVSGRPRPHHPTGRHPPPGRAKSA